MRRFEAPPALLDGLHYRPRKNAAQRDTRSRNFEQGIKKAPKGALIKVAGIN